MDPFAHSDDAAVFDFTALLLEDEAHGTVLPLSHYLKRFPRHEDAVAREYLALRSRGDAAEGDRATAAQPDAAEDGAEGVGPYRLLAPLGSGGQAAVYLAEDTQLGRRVALKVLRTPFGKKSLEHVGRMRREAEIVAALDHPSLCQVFDARLESDPPYIAMRYVAGQTLDALLQSPDEDDDVKRTRAVTIRPTGWADLSRTLGGFESLARALHVAHEAGVVHRDIKPANLMIPPEGPPVVLDFGVAERDDSLRLTRSGRSIGTPRYMSPEQLDSTNPAVDRRTDVFSLGACLYEALTGRPPFEADGVMRLVDEILRTTPPNPSGWNPKIPADVRAILAKALEKEPHRRYATALDLAEDLRRVRSFEPVAARPVGPTVRARRWARRHPALATGVVAAFGSLTIVLALTMILLQRVRAERSRAEAGLLRDASANTLESSPSTALLLAIAAAEREPGYYSNQALLRALDRHHLQAAWIGPAVAVDAAFAPDGQRAVATFQDGAVRFYDVPSGRALPELSVDLSPFTRAAWSPDGRRVAVATGTGEVWLVSATAPSPPVRLGRHAAPARQPAFAPDGHRLVTGSEAGEIACRALPGGKLLWTHDAPGPFHMAAFEPDGNLVAVALGREGAAGGVRVLDAATGAPLHPPVDLPSWVTHLAVAPNGEELAAVTQNGLLHRWDLAGGEHASVELPGRGRHVEFGPRGALIGVAFGEGTGGAWLLDRGGRLLHTLHHDGRTVPNLAFHPDGERVATCSYDGTIRLWRTDDGALEHELADSRHHQWEITWDAAGRRLLSNGNSRRVQLWAVPDRIPRSAAGSGAIVDLAFHPAGGRFLLAHRGGRVEIRETVTGRAVHILEHGAPLVRAVLDPAGRRVVTVGADARARVFDEATGSELRSLVADVGDPPTAVALDIGGRRIAIGTRDGYLRVWTLEGELLGERRAHAGEIRCLGFDPAGRWLASGGRDRALRLWEPDHLDRGPRLEHVFSASKFDRDEVFDLDFSPDGELLVFACEDLRVYGLALGDLDAGAAPILDGNQRFCRFSLDGQRIFAARAWSGAVSIHRRSDWTRVEDESEENLRLFYHQDMIEAIAALPRGPWMLTGARDGTARLWNVETGRIEALYGPGDSAVTAVAVSPDGARVLVGYAEGTVRTWPVDALATAHELTARGVDARSVLARLGLR